MSNTVIEPIVILCGGWKYKGQLIHRPSEPYAVTMRLFNSESDSEDWELSLDLLRVGADSETLLGRGKYHIRRYGNDVVFVLPSTLGSKTMMLVKKLWITRFLRRVQPAEPTYEEFNDELQKFLEGE